MLKYERQIYGRCNSSEILSLCVSAGIKKSLNFHFHLKQKRPRYSRGRLTEILSWC